jgi:hypothetical protein
VTPTVVSTFGQKVTIAGPGFPNSQGCRFGQIRAMESGQTIEQSRLLDSGGYDEPWDVDVTGFIDEQNPKGPPLPFTQGTFFIFMLCASEVSPQVTYRTDKSFTVEASGTTTTQSTTTTTNAASSSSIDPTDTSDPDLPAEEDLTKGTVSPSTATAGETTITIRGAGFKVGASLQITLATTPVTVLGTTPAKAGGDYAATLKLPATAPAGVHQLVVTGPAPDGTTHSTTATITVLPASGTSGGGTGGSASASGSGGGTEAAPEGSLPATGSEHAPLEAMAGLTALTLGALLIGLSHPAAPRRGNHRRPRVRGHSR